jgi:hypothetical protein
MSYQTVPLPPPATYDPDPIGAAIATISAHTGGFTTGRPGTIKLYNDPVMAAAVGSLGGTGYIPPQGSGMWQCELRQTLLVSGDSGDLVTFVIQFQGNQSWSNGGALQAPCPPYANYQSGYNFILANSPIMPFPSLTPGQSPGNATVFRPQVLPTYDVLVAGPGGIGNYSRLLNELYNLAVAQAGPGGSVGNLYYWEDLQFQFHTQYPQPGGGYLAAGTGLWSAYITAWTAGAGAETVIGIAGCANQMKGVIQPVNPPVSWYYTYYYNGVGANGGYHMSPPAIQVFNRFTL